MCLRFNNKRHLRYLFMVRRTFYIVAICILHKILSFSIASIDFGNKNGNFLPLVDRPCRVDRLFCDILIFAIRRAS